MTHRPALLGLLLVTFVAPVSAQGTLNLPQAHSMALEHSQEAFSIARHRSLSDAHSYKIEQRQNPELQIETTLFEHNASTGINAELTLPYKPGQKSQRQSLATTIRRVSDLEEKMSLLSLKHRVTQAYLDLWVIQAHKAFLQENLQFAHNTRNIVLKASRYGEVGKAVSSLLNAEVLKYEDELIELNTQGQFARIRLYQLINQPLETVDLETPILGVLPAQIDSEEAPLAKELLKARLNVANHQVALAKKEAALPELSPRFFYNEGFDSDSRTFGVGVRMQWPLSGSNRGELARAQAEKAYATESLAAFDRLGYDALVEHALAQVQQIQHRTKTYNQKIIPAFQESFKVMQKMFKNGQASAIELWQFHERLHEAEIKKLKIFEQAFVAEMALESLLGTTLNQPAYRGE